MLTRDARGFLEALLDSTETAAGVAERKTLNLKPPSHEFYEALGAYRALKAISDGIRSYLRLQ